MVDNTVTDSNGLYPFTGVSPGAGYQIRFREPSTGTIFGQAVTNEQGVAYPNTRDTGASTVNPGTNAGNPAGGVEANGELQNLTLLSGDNIVQQSLPLDPAVWFTTR